MHLPRSLVSVPLMQRNRSASMQYELLFVSAQFEARAASKTVTYALHPLVERIRVASLVCDRVTGLRVLLDEARCSAFFSRVG